jgi:periplasmic mercuric ion binding protein
MKKYFISIILAMVCGFAYAQDTPKKEVVTAFFKVSGNCEQCKKRIENAADIKGVKTSDWNADTKVLKVVYRADKVTEKDIKQAIAKAGHDVESFVADEASYNKLPGCCQYRDRKCEEKK